MMHRPRQRPIQSLQHRSAQHQMSRHSRSSTTNGAVRLVIRHQSHSTLFLLLVLPLQLSLTPIMLLQQVCGLHYYQYCVCKILRYTSMPPSNMALPMQTATLKTAVSHARCARLYQLRQQQLRGSAVASCAYLSMLHAGVASSKDDVPNLSHDALAHDAQECVNSVYNMCRSDSAALPPKYAPMSVPWARQVLAAYEVQDRRGQDAWSMLVPFKLRCGLQLHAAVLSCQWQGPSKQSVTSSHAERWRSLRDT